MKWSLDRKILIGVGIVLAALVVNAIVSYRATSALINHQRLVSHTHQVLTELEATMSTMKDAETGERGFIITGDTRYLEPYQTAIQLINDHVSKLKELTADNSNQQVRIPVLEQKIKLRLATLQQGINQKKNNDVEGVRQLIISGAGKAQMDDLRQFIDLMERDEQDLLKQRSEEASASGRYAFITDFIPNLIACGLLLLVAYVLFGDITARRKVEEELRRQREWLAVTLASIGDAVIATDTNGAVTFVNPIAESLTGWKQEEARGQSLQKIFDIVNEETRAPVENPALRAMQEGVVIGLANHTVLIAKHGAETCIDDSGAPIMDADGRLVGAVLIFRDITERRRVEQERAKLLASERAAREHAETASRAKDEFVAMISHEIRSPLTAIMGWTQMLKKGKLNEAETARAIDTIERNAKNQVQLVEDLLDVSRVITGKLRLNVQTVDPVQTIEAAIDSIRPAVEAKEILVHRDLEQSGSVVSGDADRLQQIFWNLLSNAVKFTPRRGRITLRLQRIKSNLEISVSDSGEGISAEFLPYVFDRFSQANLTSERKHGGLGLGLAIVRYLVELHGGYVRAESAGAGQGTTFTVTLPIMAAREEVRNAASYSSANYVSTLANARLDGLRVMVVDDESETLELLTAMLSQRGAEVKACASASEALNEIPTWLPAILVSDIGMPGQDGYSLIRLLRALSPEQGGTVPAVALTSFTRTEDRMRALSAGFQMHVKKPIDLDELITVIASLAGRKGKSIATAD